jgi:hypothetical protein
MASLAQPDRAASAGGVVSARCNKVSTGGGFRKPVDHGLHQTTDERRTPRRDEGARTPAHSKLVPFEMRVEAEALEFERERSEFLLPRASSQVTAPLAPQLVQLALRGLEPERERRQELGEPAHVARGQSPALTQPVQDLWPSGATRLSMLPDDGAAPFELADVGAYGVGVDPGAAGDLVQGHSLARGERAQDRDSDWIAEQVEEVYGLHPGIGY